MSATSEQSILVTAASGNIGSRLVPMLLKDQSNPKVVLSTTNAARLSQTYKDAPSQLAIEEGNVQDPQWVEAILKKHKVTSVVLCLTGENELFITLNFLNAMQRAGTVKHLVYISACGDFSLDAVKAGLSGLMPAGHVVVKFILEAHLKFGVLPPTADGGFTHTVLGPTLFFDNDLRIKKSIMQKSFFDEPLSHKGQSRVDPSDIALAAYNSLIHDRGQKYHGEKIMIGSKKAYTLEEIRQMWCKGLGREIKFSDGSNEEDMDEFEGHFREVPEREVWRGLGI